jgi:hypothetical protein
MIESAGTQPIGLPVGPSSNWTESRLEQVVNLPRLIVDLGGVTLHENLWRMDSSEIEISGFVQRQLEM